MSLKKLFVDTRALKRCSQGPLFPHLDYFTDWLEEAGFAYSSIKAHVTRIVHWSGYLGEQGLKDVSTMTAEHITEFMENHLPNCNCRRLGSFRTKETRSSLHRFLGYLKEKGLADPLGREESILQEYGNWCLDNRSLSSGTSDLRCSYLGIFLKIMEKKGITIQALTGDLVENLFLEYAQGKGKSSRRSMQGTLRSFFIFCKYQGYLEADLSTAVPTLRTYRLDKVPKGIKTEEALHIIAGTSTQTVAGIRDKALLQILFTYGVRGGQVRALCLEDIDWSQGLIYFAPLKGGKEVHQPLTNEVGEALLIYLEKARPKTKYREVFLTTRAPFHSLKNKALSEIVRRCIKASGVRAPSHGSHVFRHTFATRLLEQGESLKTIADMLGHRCIHTTFQYTKVDVSSLSKVALEWPEVHS